MELDFDNQKMGKLCASEKDMNRKLGPRRANVLRRRLEQIRAADNLADLGSLPQVNLHELSGNRKGQLTVDLDQPYRLALEPLDNPAPKKDDGGLDWEAVTGVSVIEVFDPH